MNTNKKIGLVIVAVVIAVGLFYGGTRFGEARTMRGGMQGGQFGRGGTPTGMGGAYGGRTGGTQFGGRGVGTNGGFVIGQVLSKDDKSITVQLQGGGSKIVFTSPATPVMKSDQGTLNDVSVGSNVMVQGSANTDGSVTAQSIQIRPATSTQPQLPQSQPVQ